MYCILTRFCTELRLPTCIKELMMMMHQLQIRPIVHNYRASPNIPPTYIRVRAVVWASGQGHTHTHTQTALTNIRFASSTTHAKRNNCFVALCYTGQPVLPAPSVKNCRIAGATLYCRHARADGN